MLADALAVADSEALVDKLAPVSTIPPIIFPISPQPQRALPPYTAGSSTYSLATADSDADTSSSATVDVDSWSNSAAYTTSVSPITLAPPITAPTPATPFKMSFIFLLIICLVFFIKYKSIKFLYTTRINISTITFNSQILETFSIGIFCTFLSTIKKESCIQDSFPHSYFSIY